MHKSILYCNLVISYKALVGEKPADKPLSMDMKDLCTDKQEALDAQS